MKARIARTLKYIRITFIIAAFVIVAAGIWFLTILVSASAQYNPCQDCQVASSECRQECAEAKSGPICYQNCERRRKECLDTHRCGAKE